MQSLYFCDARLPLHAPEVQSARVLRGVEGKLTRVFWAAKWWSQLSHAQVYSLQKCKVNTRGSCKGCCLCDEQRLLLIENDPNFPSQVLLTMFALLTRTTSSFLYLLRPHVVHHARLREIPPVSPLVVAHSHLGRHTPHPHTRSGTLTEASRPDTQLETRTMASFQHG